MASFHRWCLGEKHDRAVPGRPKPAGVGRHHSLPCGRFHVSDVMLSLQAGVPISLLVDLLAPEGPDSAGILIVEAPDVDDTWIQRIAS